jgi:hypothetical protein
MLIIGSVSLLGSATAVILATSSGPALAMAAFFEGGTIGGVIGVLIVLGLPEIRRED